MTTRTRTRTSPGRSLLVGLAAGLLSAGAQALEEVTVYGTDTAAVKAEEAERRAELRADLEALIRQLKQQLDEDLKKQQAASIKLAVGTDQSRG